MSIAVCFGDKRSKSVLWVIFFLLMYNFTGENTAESGRSQNSVLKARENIFNHW